ncbi:PREDICTED: uncharacterized protein LOC107165873 [Diuraphis noxia]|uniref:uncharacterized protein LOC107165873 n=1 Tax=Diuraphis noxia TaxID=143948 RepID=UPI00076376F9|nr:PREDICTED: uncharacterized protein LOC107165873 [Diuraphis noxia]
MFYTSDSSFLAHRSLHLWKKIGEGSFSKVYLAKFGDTENDKATLIATKVINKNRVSTKFVEKFLPRELDVMIKLRHPFIVQMEKNFTFRRSLVRSRTLKDLTSTFLEPNFQKRTKIKTALQHPWIKEGNIKIPTDVIVANESITTSLSQPIVTETSLKVPAFHYQLSEYGKPISADNILFTAVAAESGVIKPKSKHKLLKLKK